MTRCFCLRTLPISFAATLSLFCGPRLHSQTHKVPAPERVTRAVAVYEWTGALDKPTASRLIPVSIFINRRLEDADVYLARPVPFALQTGDVYEVDEAGQKKGVFDVDHARNTQSFTKEVADTSAGGWYGFGKFTPPAAAAKAPALQPSKQLATITSTGNSARPHFGSTPPDDAKDASASRPVGSTAPDASGDAARTAGRDTAAVKDNDDGRSDNDVDRPTLRKRDPAEEAQRRKEAAQSGVKGPDVSLNDDPDRPTLRHVAPAEANAVKDLAGLPADMHQAAAVSDAANREPHVFARKWDSAAERSDTLARMQALARARISSYVATNQLSLGTPIEVKPVIGNSALPAAIATPPASTDDENAPKLQRGVPSEYQHPRTSPKAASTTTARTSSHTRVGGKPAAVSAKGSIALILKDEQLRPYTLTYGGLPTFVYTAQADLRTGGPVYVAIVAQRMISGDLQVSLSSVTDASHLDRTPWMRLVDAVDPDASHRASLLFELREQTSRQFALYRLTSPQAEQTFITSPM